jgi:PAS domain S-box-containing protein
MENLSGWDHSEDHPDFDPNLLNVEAWGVDSHQTDDVDVNVDQHDIRDSRKKNIASSTSWGDSDRHVDQWSSLAVSEFDHPDNSATSTSKQDVGNNSNDNLNGNNLHLQQSGIDETVEAAVEAAVAAISETSDSVTSGDRSGGSSENNTYSNISQHLHPLGIQSSASCPTPAHANGSTIHQQELQQVQHPAQHYQQQHQQQHQLQQQQQQQRQHTIQGVCGVNLSQQLKNSAAATKNTTAPTITSPSPATQHLSSLTANFMLAQAANSTIAATNAAAAANATSTITAAGSVSQDHQQQHTATISSQPSNIPTCIANNNVNSKTSGAASGKQRTRRSKSASKTKKKKGNNYSNAAPDTTSSRLPPFYLFDAPIELRANFMQNQRRLGLPIQHDPNSYHYGETVNGFHPHQYQVPFGANASNAAAGVAVPPNVRSPNSPPPQLIDARHGNHRKNKGGQVKNEREQKRAQKITELIEQLRLQMEEGGWQVEARSKFHTLSNCAQYIKHMIKITSDKENENEKLNSELDGKRLKLEREKEEKAIQEGRSDPESVTSSLTSDTTMSTARHKQEEETSGESGTKKRKLSKNSNQEEGSSGDDSNNNNDANNNGNNKKHRITSSEATTEDSSGDDNRDGSGTGSGSGNSRTESGSGGSGEISKTISSVSELTDSNRGSSSNNSGSGGGSSDYVPTEQDSREFTSGTREDNGPDQNSTSSISSDAAVASEKTSRDRNTGHKDVVFNNDKRMSRKRPPEEVTSLERTFELNYEEVFHKSNIPQLIASTSGKIVTWNECFSKATGYRKSEIERMTIFSLVKPENLANFFEIVAAALRPDDEEIVNGTNNCGRETVDSSNNSPSLNSFGEDLSGRETVICSNNQKYSSEQGGNKNTDVQKHGVNGDDEIQLKKDEELSAKSEEGNESENIVSRNSIAEESIINATEGRVTNNIDADNVSGNSTNEENSSYSTEKGGASKIDTENTSRNPANEEVNLNSTEEEGAIKPDTDDACRNSTHEETSSSSTECEGTNDIPGTSNEGPKSTEEWGAEKTSSLSKENHKSASLNVEEGEEKEKEKPDTYLDESLSNRLLNYTAMTLPCIDFPAMIKRNKSAVESNSVIIQPLHITVTLMSDKDPRRQCFHCVFTNSKGTNGHLGIITPELLASLFAKPVRNTNRRKKNNYSTHGGGGHQHQRKRARGGTTRVGQSVSTSTPKSDEQNHCVKHIVSTNEEHEKPPSPLLMPPPGPPTDDNSKQGESEPKKIESEMIL